jgi:hypothetical protein
VSDSARLCTIGLTVSVPYAALVWCGVAGVPERKPPPTSIVEGSNAA